MKKSILEVEMNIKGEVAKRKEILQEVVLEEGHIEGEILISEVEVKWTKRVDHKEERSLKINLAFKRKEKK